MPAAEAGILMVLQDVEKFGLQMGGHFRDFVEEDGSFISHFEFAGLGAHRARKRALLETEQFGLQQFSRQGRTIDFYERLAAPLRAQVNHARHYFFTNSAFPTNENRHVHWSDLENLLT